MPQAVEFEANDGKIVADPDKIVRQVVCERGLGRRCIVLALADYFGVLDLVLGELVFDVKLADGVDLIAKEIKAVGVIVAIAVDVHDATAYSVLSWLEDKIHALKAEIQELAAEFGLLEFLSGSESEAASGKFFFGRNGFGERLGVGNNG